jgi:hypothetical protein
MGDTPRQEYPSTRPVIPFEKWLEAKFLDRWQDLDPNLNSERDHFENRCTYVEYVLWTWEDPKRWMLDRFDLQQIGRTMRDESHPYGNARLPKELRVRAWNALSCLFRDLFEPCTSGVLCHKNERSETPDLDGACYMWWDVSPYFPGSPKMDQEDNKYFLSICEQCLKSPNATMQESAIHGLGHALGVPERLKEAATLLNGYLESDRFPRRELTKYAKKARHGRIQ